ncbi:MAG: ABC transporter substrate-binding protein [Deltaproteobacteria bacterium]|nr:ABC transporter substrate-binding protein [Deltaproteobacteria bacterium]MBI2532244.1 ABC transporter substrate-binding protein [Deltaproteobacteria bacterium]
MNQFNRPLSLRLLVWEILLALFLIILNVPQAHSQDKRTKVRISNAGFTITALPLLAAKDWGAFAANGLDVELIVMNPSLAAAAVAQGDIDYVAGVGPASVAATLSGLQSRAIWFSSDRISYWLMARPQFKSVEDLKGKKIAISGGAGGTNHVALMIALEKSGANPKDFAMVGIPGQQIQVLYSLESNFVEGALISPPVTFNAYKKGFNKLLDVGSMVEMPGGGLTTLIKTIQSRPGEVKKVIHALQSAKDEVRKSKSKTVELIIRLLKMDKEAASETYDTFLTTLNPSGVPNRAGIDNLVRSLQAQGRFTDRKIAFTDVADDRLATEVAKELGYKLP